MNLKRTTIKYPILFLTVFAFPASGLAQAIGVSPDSWDFGNVQVGDSAVRQFLISSIDPLTPIELGEISIESDPVSAFAITYIDPVPSELYVEDGPVVLEVTFTPPFAGVFDAVLRIESNATHDFPPDGVVDVPLTGETSPIADILDFYDTAVEEGLLVGHGPGSSAGGRLKALRNMIESAGDLIDEGELEHACVQLMDAYDRCDGDPRPPDFVAGSAAPVLNELLYLFLTCEE